MSSGSGSGSTPNTPISTTIPPMSPIVPSPFLQQPTAGGIRYPLYAGNHLVYSPGTMFAGMSWRPLAQVSSTTGSSVSTPPLPNHSHHPLVPPGMVYPLMTPLLPTTKLSKAPDALKKSTGTVETGKHEIGHTHYKPEAKRLRLSEGIPSSPVPTSSPPSHPSTPTHIHKPTDQWSGQIQQRSPVIINKVISYPGHTIILPTRNTHQKSTPQTIVLPITSLPKAVVPKPPCVSSPSLCGRSTEPVPSEPRLTATMSRLSSRSVSSQVPLPPLLNKMHIVLFKCLGSISNSVLNHQNITVSNQLHDLFKQVFGSTAMLDSLSPESVCCLTICYLNSLRSGEAINVENLRTMIHYAQAGESEWIQYHKKHKKMSESTYVQSQLMHLSRMSVYPTHGRIQVQTANRSLTDGVIQVLYNLQCNSPSLPDYVVVMSMHISTIVNFCVLAVEPLQVLQLREVELAASIDSKRKRPAVPKKSNPSPSSKICLSSELLSVLKRFEKRWKGAVLLPFYQAESGKRLPLEKAESLIPSSSHVIEHKPTGPFHDQYSMAVVLLQKIAACFNSDTKIEQFNKIDFRVLCPPDASFVAQTVSEVIKSGLVEYLEDLSPNKTSGTPSNQDLSSQVCTDYEAEAQRRVVCCNLVSDTPRFQGLINDVQNNKDTLYLLIIENAHLTTKIASKLFHSLNEGVTSTPSTSDSLSLLSNTSNTVFLNISSFPYSLQTSSCLIPSATNQIHWPLKKPSTGDEKSTSTFCILRTFRKAQENLTIDGVELGVSYKEDASFEELFHKTATKLNESPSLLTSLISLRGQLLLEQYIACLLATVGQPQPTFCAPPSPETLSIVTQLVNGPMLNGHGRGNMLLIRCHDAMIGHQFYLSLKEVRNSLGYQFRFEVLFDDGSHLLSVSDHFARRISQRGCGQNDHVTSYRDLEGIPCVVVLAGEARAGLAFPKSLCWVDLRLCYPLQSFSRLTYEYDLSLFNGHYSPLSGRGPVRLGGDDSDKLTRTEESDSVFDPTPSPCTTNGHAHRRSSSSSSRKSSCGDDTKQAMEEGGVISWRPVGETRTSSFSSSESPTGTVNIEQSSPVPQEVEMSTSGTVTVTIDPPSDENQFYFSANLCKIPFTVSPTEEDMEWNEDISDVESDSDEEERTNQHKVCLLSRPYYHVWSSKNPHQNLLLPPSQGVTWSGGNRRPPLFDSDPHNQSMHYFKWSKPSNSHDRTHLDAVSKEAANGAARRFLLTGPPQTGKTSTWHMLVRLLHDHLRSLKGVTIEMGTPVDSIFLQNSSPHLQSSGRKHSKIVTMEQLTEQLYNGVASKDFQKLSSEVPVTIEFSKPAIMTISASPYMAYDVSHSCKECPGPPVSRSSTVPLLSDLFTSKLPQRDGSFITLKWHVPPSQASLCVVREETMYIKLSCTSDSDETVRVKTPVFVPTMGRDLTGLFNLFHAGYDQIQVLVTVETQFEKYCKAWPNLTIMAIPNQDAIGLGATYHIIKSFAQHNYQLNRQQLSGNTLTPWPMVAIMSDNIVMWKKVTGSRTENISMSEALLSLEGPSVNCLQYAALGVPTWRDTATESCSLSNYDLSHDFIMFNLSQTAQIDYNQFSFNSADVGFNIALHGAGLKAMLVKDLAIVKKHLTTGGNKYLLHTSISSLAPDVDKVVVSLHHNSSSHLPYPGPYLMEHFLLHKSLSLFPHAVYPSHPVLIFDHYITLGPRTHVTMVQSSHCTEGSDTKMPASVENVQFGGLLLYLCEGRLNSEQINRLNFVSGACLCLVTRDCKTLVQEVARLDLEEKWKFLLRDQHQTACSDSMKPLFIFIGRYEG